jgi:antitoxin VapB
MKQTSIKSDRVAELLERITRHTGESKVEAVTVALEQRWQALAARNRADHTLAWLEASVWPNLPARVRGKAPSKEEQEDLLGY